MVASDTVVGLVGVGVLIVALVGVFVYESREAAGESPNLDTSHYDAESSGTVEIDLGTRPAGLPAEVPCQDPVCRNARTMVDLDITGLPQVHEPIHYTGFLDHGANAQPRYTFVGNMRWESGKYMLNFDQAQSRSTDRLIISLESGASPTMPRFEILSFDLDSETTNIRSTEMVHFLEGGQHSLTLSQRGDQVNVTAEVNNANRTDYSYAGWLVSELDGQTTYEFVDVDVAENGRAEIRGNVEGRVSDFDRFIVTLETIGFSATSPQGPIIASASV